MTDTEEQTAPPPEEPPVEIHKPKPVHNWREFLIELGTIVLGICIALAGEQTIEWLHWRSQVQDARKAIHAEITRNEASLFARRLNYKPCMDRQRQEAETILADLEGGRPPGRFTSFHAGTAGPTSSGAWEAQRAGQTLTHFPPEELAMMAQHYASLSEFQGFIARENASWAELAGLRNPPKGLGPADFMRLRNSLADASHFDNLMDIYVIRALRLGDALGIPRPVLDARFRRIYCSTTDAEYLQSVKDSEAGQR